MFHLLWYQCRDPRWWAQCGGTVSLVGDWWSQPYCRQDHRCLHLGPRAASRGQRGFSCLCLPLFPARISSTTSLITPECPHAIICSQPSSRAISLPRGLVLSGFSGASPLCWHVFQGHGAFEGLAVSLMLYLLSLISFCWSFLLPSGWWLSIFSPGL